MCSLVHFELNFGYLTIQKCELIEVEKPEFLKLESHLKLIFGIWKSPKCDFGELKKTTLLVVARHCDLIFCLLSFG